MKDGEKQKHPFNEFYDDYLPKKYKAKLTRQQCYLLLSILFIRFDYLITRILNISSFASIRSYAFLRRGKLAKQDIDEHKKVHKFGGDDYKEEKITEMASVIHKKLEEKAKKKYKGIVTYTDIEKFMKPKADTDEI
jgi:hypothetical protein